MLALVSGVVKAIKEQAVIVDIGFVGLQVQVPQESLYHVEQKVQLYTYMHWNQENGPSLFGFPNELEKTVFLTIIDCSGIGPKIGLAVLSDLGAARFIEIVQAEDTKGLSKVNGIGPKKAEQMIVQLKHKVAKLLDNGLQVVGSAQVTQWHNLQEVLESLNYSRPEIAATLKQLRESEPQTTAPFDQLMRRALSFLAKK